MTGTYRGRRGGRGAGSAGALLGWAAVIGLAVEWLSLSPSPVPRDAAPQAALAHKSLPDDQRATFTLCHRGGGDLCVVDGDTFRFEGKRIRIADIDAPETHPPRCAQEAALGDRATLRLQALLNAGAFSLRPIDRDTDRYGRQLRVVARNGRSLGDQLVAEGLARPYAGGHRDGWCS